ncbi:MAG: hypothetical protein GYA51_10815 [Candidatus Methanofastidiosa archaeon]|jgi:hypothetical protein|nr:hypothetical protein [Candidatus Methanofastidiosa archaeon]
MKLTEFEKMVYTGLMHCEKFEDCDMLVKESIKMLNELKDQENIKPYYLTIISNLSTMLQMMAHSLSVQQFKEELSKIVELD